VIHTASPLFFTFTDAQKEIITPALNGTRGILEAVKRFAPSVKRVVITSSFAAILSEEHFTDPNAVFSESTWNPDTVEDASRSIATGYAVSKVAAERLAWDFIKNEKPNFDLVTVNPPLVIGPVAHSLASLDSINASNARIADLLQGKWKTEIDPTGPVDLYSDVRDTAEAHIKALELPEASGRRLFTVAGRTSNHEYAKIVRENFPEYADKVPGPEVPGGEPVDENKAYKWNCDETDKLLKIKWIPVEKSLIDAVHSLKAQGL
jgi:nucleoside-diphosphate-sugar epimerase